MWKRGFTAAGKQRWICPYCRHSGIRKRPDARRRGYRAAFVRWIGGVASQKDIARQLRISERTLRRRFAPLYDCPPPSPSPRYGADILILDALYLGARTSHSRAVLIAKTPSGVYAWRFAEAETKAAWSDFVSSMPAPRFVVTDGAKPLIDAVCGHWSHALRQRCLAHVARYAGRELRSGSRSPAKAMLAKLVRELKAVCDTKSRDIWLRKFRAWENKYAALLSARWWKVDWRNHRYAMRSHPSLCRAHRHLSDALPHLFSYLWRADAPRTTNHLEGGVSARLRKLLRGHCGMSVAHQCVLAAQFLASQTPRSYPRNVL